MRTACRIWRRGIGTGQPRVGGEDRMGLYSPPHVPSPSFLPSARRCHQALLSGGLPVHICSPELGPRGYRASQVIVTQLLPPLLRLLSESFSLQHPFPSPPSHRISLPLIRPQLTRARPPSSDPPRAQICLPSSPSSPSLLVLLVAHAPLTVSLPPRAS